VDSENEQQKVAKEMRNPRTLIMVSSHCLLTAIPRGWGLTSMLVYPITFSSALADFGLQIPLILSKT
jgi:hypothetical protein